MSARPLRRSRQSPSSQNLTEKENAVKVNSVARSKVSNKASKVYCSCRQPDDGTPMICCSECKEWYHFRCLQLDNRDAEDIQIYVCAPCTAKTGLHTVMEWEGPEAVEDCTNLHIDPALLSNAPTMPDSTRHFLLPDEPEESSDEGSEDDYVADEVKRKGKRRTNAASSDSEDLSDSGTKTRVVARQSRRPAALSVNTKTRSVSGSPGLHSPAVKRKKSTASQEPNAKRKRSESLATPGAGADAARKYCVTKLQEIFVNIFTNYPVLQEPGDDDELVVMKQKESLTAEEKEQLEEKGRRFASELEDCIFDTYSEPDAKTGYHVVGMKYKERFRMLTFNLSKSDRVVLHQRIAASHITPKELSTMSSTDLADEETKQSIKQAEQEALAHSILKKTSMPTAKMTHKGMQDIEDMSGTLSRERERERQQEEEEERIERERLERLKFQAQKAQTTHGSVPPESPTTPTTATWGAPPPVPLHALHGSEAGPSSSRPPLNPLFIHTSSEIATSPVEHELNLADLINIDEEPGQELSISLADPVVPPISDSASIPSEPAADNGAASTSQSAPPTSATGLSPFASKSSHPDLTPRPSFDLNAIWSTDSGVSQSDSKDVLMQESEPEPEPERPASPELASGHGLGADDRDFDMFLQGGEEEEEAPTPQPSSPESIQAAFDASPHVWTGKVSMPLDSMLSQEVSVSARQIGGRTLGGDSLLWRTLFPTDHLRIDGRVPVDKSAEYLTQMRLNPHKELFAVAFAPPSQSSTDSFATLSKYLIGKNRHGLVFPWGNRPKEHHPGRELYIVPLVASEPLPEFLELLDEMKLPRTRQSDLMVGIWVLNKGKLAPPPASSMPSIPPPAIAPAPEPLTAAPHLSSAPSLLPSAVLASLPVPLLPPSGQLPPNVSAEALAAEVASLTPEQIQLMLQTLTAGGHQAPPIPPHPAPVLPVPPMHSQPWMAGAPPPFPPYGPPPYANQPVPPYAPPPPPPTPPRERYGFDRDRPPYPPRGGHQHEPYSRGSDRGQRGRSSNSRNRDRGGQERPRDSGWGGRGRGRGRGGHAGDSRDREKQWSGPPQQQW